MTPLETFTAIGAKLFQLSGRLGEPMELRTRTDGSYSIVVQERSLSFEFADRNECLAFLQQIDGDDAAVREAVRQRKADRLQARIAEDQQALDNL